MNSMFLGFRLPMMAASAVVFSVALGLGTTAKGASPDDPAAFVASVDKQADTHARSHLQAAISHMTAHDRRLAADRLERAETALLNRQSLDQGADLKLDQPLAKTQLMQSIDETREALEARDLPRARQLVKQAIRETTSDIEAMSD